jgi:hypothetical protein
LQNLAPLLLVPVQIATSVVDTGGKFATGVVGTGGAPLTCEYLRQFFEKL